MELLWPTGSDLVDTLIMPEALWEQVAVEAEAGGHSTPPLVGGAVVTDPFLESFGALAALGGVSPNGAMDVTEIPPTQPSPRSPVKPHGSPDAKASEPEPEPKEPTPEKSEETKKQEEEEPKFPMVTREAQQTFKSARANVRKMDAAAEQPKNSSSATGRGSMKRPAAAAKVKATAKAKAAKMASPVRVASDGEEVEVVEPRNLLETFEEVADGEKEEKKGQGRPRAAPKASPKKTRTRTKTSKQTAQLSPIAKRLAKKPNKEKSDQKKDKTVEKSDQKKDKTVVTPDKSEETGGKKTFAGRRCPKTSKEAIQRFECLRASFQSSIQPRVSGSMSFLEVGY